jgi:hypothetical protein
MEALTDNYTAGEQLVAPPSSDPSEKDPRPNAEHVTKSDIPNASGQPAKSENLAKQRSPKSPTFRSEIGSFAQNIEALASTLPLVMALLGESEKKVGSEFAAFIKGKIEVAEPGSARLRLAGEEIQRFRRLGKRVTASANSSRLVPISFLVSLVSQFDSYIGKLMRLVLLAVPEIMNASDRTLSFSDLVRFGSLDDTREFMIEKEIESVIRLSHSDQFAWFENKLKLPLRKELDAWPRFVELTERRNLFVHSDGVVSSQYLVVCCRHGALLGESCGVGQRLDVTLPYFQSAFEWVYEIGVKLAQVLWRKLKPEELDGADGNLIEIGYELLVSSEIKLAMTLLDFATMTLKKHSSEDARRTLVVNRAQAYKWSGAKEKCTQILDAEDWSASSDKFRLAVAVLREDYSSAAELTEKTAKSEEMHPAHFKDWPLFREFRKTEHFLRAFEKGFGKPFALDEVATKDGLDGSLAVIIEKHSKKESEQ